MREQQNPGAGEKPRPSPPVPVAVSPISADFPRDSRNRTLLSVALEVPPVSHCGLGAPISLLGSRWCTSFDSETSSHHKQPLRQIMEDPEAPCIENPRELQVQSDAVQDTWESRGPRG